MSLCAACISFSPQATTSWGTKMKSYWSGRAPQRHRCFLPPGPRGRRALFLHWTHRHATRTLCIFSHVSRVASVSFVGCVRLVPFENFFSVYCQNDQCASAQTTECVSSCFGFYRRRAVESQQNVAKLWTRLLTGNKKKRKRPLKKKCLFVLFAILPAKRRASSPSQSRDPSQFKMGIDSGFMLLLGILLTLSPAVQGICSIYTFFIKLYRLSKCRNS